MLTPGHVTYCAPVEGEDNPFAGKDAPILDILRSDGALLSRDKTLIRASTGAVVGSYEDRLVWAAIGMRFGNTIKAPRKQQIRVGMRYILPNGQTVSVAEMIENLGATLNNDGMLVRNKDDGKVYALNWEHSATLPKPEDYILQRSDVTLEEIYAANEWESVKPEMPAPVAGEAGRSYKQPNATLYAASGGGSKASHNHMPRNVPLSMRGTDAEKTHIAPQEAKPAGQVMTRKQRRAHEARMRKGAKSRKRVMV